MDSADSNRMSSPWPNTVDEWPAQIGRYRILEKIGAGGMGTVYKAQDPQLNRVVAVKVPRFDGPDDVQSNRRQRFQREAQAAAQVRHPHVCPVYDVGEQHGQPFVVMAYIDGLSLAEHLSRKGSYENPGFAVALIRQVLDALGAIHAQEIVHRDLKPSNIMLDADGRALVMDFGLARTLEGAEYLTSDGMVIGTPAYMAPEQAAGLSDQIGPLTDLYSVGVILYQLVTGRLPWQGSAVAVLAHLGHDDPPSPCGLRPGLDPALGSIILKAMARAPHDRYQSAREFDEALVDWSATPSQPTVRRDAASEKTDANAPAAPRPRTNRRTRIIRVAILAVLIGAGAYVFVPAVVQKWNGFERGRQQGQELNQKSKDDQEAKEEEHRQQMAADALTNVRRSGQAIATRAYPFAIGGVTYNNASLENFASQDDGYEVTVRLNYSNALSQSYYLEILVSYDSEGSFKSWRLGRNNDPFPPNIRNKSFDRWLD